MKIESINIENLYGARAVHANLPKPITLFAGFNRAGKSSVRDAVKLAITGDLTRITVKKDSGLLVTENAANGFVAVTCDGIERAVTITRGGKISEKGGKRDIPEALRFAFDGQRFARMKVDDRRAFLFDLMGLSLEPAAVVERLRKRNLVDAYIDRIAPLLRSGFPAALEEAKTYAREAKADWRSATGEMYGSEKANGWSAEKPDVDKKLIAECEKQLLHIDAARSTWQEQVGKLKQQAAQREELTSRVPKLQAEIDLAERRRRKLEHDRGELATARASLESALAAAGDLPRIGLVHDLAGWLWWVMESFVPSEGLSSDDQGPVDRARAVIAAYENEHGRLGQTASDPEARKRADALKRAVDLLASAVANGERDVAASDAAAAELEQVKKQLAELPEATGLAAAQREVADLDAKRRAEQDKLNAHETLQRRAAQADQKTRDAAAAHTAVTCWEALAEALAPSGIQAEMLSEALLPLNQRLQQSSADADWPCVRITDDIAVVLGDHGRPYELFAESEQWRADAMLAEAFAFISGVRLLVLDRADMLDMKGRDDLFTWLQVLVEANELDSALVFATLRALPLADQLPAGVQAVWIADGRTDAANTTTAQAQQAA